MAVIPIGLFILITLLVYIPSMTKNESYRPGQAWRGEPTWFGGPRGGFLEAAESKPRRSVPAVPTRAGEAQVAAGDAFSSAQRHEIDKAIRDAETLSRIEFSVYVGSRRRRGPCSSRSGSTRALVAPDRSVLVLVDPAAQNLEIVTGSDAHRVLDDAEVKLAAAHHAVGVREPATSWVASPGACSSSPSTPGALELRHS